MKIWTVITDQDGEGTATAVHTTEAAACGAYARIVAASWESWFGAHAAPMPDDTAKAWEVLTMQTGFMDSVTLTCHDISDHPALSLAVTALQDAETFTGRLIADPVGTLFAMDHGNLIDLHDSLADAAAVLAGRMAADAAEPESLPVAPSLHSVIVWHEPQDIAECGEIATHDGINAPDVDPQNPAHVAIIRAWMQHIGPSARDAMNDKFWDWIPRDLVSMQREIAESLTTDHATAVKLDALHREGFVVGIRDHRINTDFPGAFMVAELYEDHQLPTKDGCNLPAIVGDDLQDLINNAHTAFVEA